MSELLTVKQLADRWQLGEATIRNYLSRSDINMPKVTKIGSRTRFKISDVEEFESREK